MLQPSNFAPRLSLVLPLLLSPPAFAQAPGSDCQNTIPIATGSTVLSFDGTSSGAVSSCLATPGATDIWFRTNTMPSGILTVSTCGTNDLGGIDLGPDTVITIFDFQCTTELACSDDAPLGACATPQGGNLFDASVSVPVSFFGGVVIRVSTPTAGSFESFVLSIEYSIDFESFCTGGGGDQMGCSDCPCNNNVTPGYTGGCANDLGAAAQLFASGSASVTAPPTEDLEFKLLNSWPNSLAVLVSGSAQAPQNPSNPCFGQNPGSGIQSASSDGLRCVVGDILRHGSRPTGPTFGDVGVSVFPDLFPPTNPWGGAFGPNPSIAAQSGFVAGETRYFQVIYRTGGQDTGCGTGQNSSQGLIVTFEP